MTKLAALVTLVLLAVVVLNVAHLVWYRSRGRRGLDQWPHPHGPYYDEWLRLTDVGDYYDWLAKRLRSQKAAHVIFVLLALLACAACGDSDLLLTPTRNPQPVFGPPLPISGEVDTSKFVNPLPDPSASPCRRNLCPAP